MPITLPATAVTPTKPAVVQTERGFEIAVFQHGDSYFAIANRCPHQGAPLVQGVCDGEVVICPFHHFKYDLRTGRCRFPRHLRIATFPVARAGTDLSIDTSAAPDPSAPSPG